MGDYTGVLKAGLFAKTLKKIKSDLTKQNIFSIINKKKKTEAIV